jgi:enoyl-CoA hydratase
LLRDKDGEPKWSPAHLEDVTADIVERYFTPLGDDEFDLPSRSEMQTARV